MSSAYRIERDSLGEVEVAEAVLWGAQTQRAIAHFRIGDERMPIELIRAMARIKASAAEVNAALGLLDDERARAIAEAADEVFAGRHDEQFPLSIWQSGSGTQTHMNLNEVLANRASELIGGTRGVDRCVHANDHVNLGQSTNDVFPTAIHLAAIDGLSRRLLPALRALQATLAAKAVAFADIVKIGRTHLQDATPLSLGQEIGAWAAQLGHAEMAIEDAMESLHELAIGGTAVGTGLNTHPRFGVEVAARLAALTGQAFRCAGNRFAALAAHEPLVTAHAALRTLAVALMKIANDVRWLASGPRCGLGELTLPANEPGSSIMPGKVNPTQCEAMTMVCCQVLGNDLALTIGAASGNFELNVFKPVIARNFLHSLGLLADVMVSFDIHCARDIEADRARIAELLANSLMLVTALSPHIGYDRAAQIARHAHSHALTLRQAALALGLVTESQFDEWVKPERMT